MRQVKRLEIVVEASRERAVERLIELAGIEGYTLTRGVAGRGQRGERDNDGLTGTFANVCFLVAAEPDAAATLIESVRPVLREVGGMCLVTDAAWVEH